MASHPEEVSDRTCRRCGYIASSKGNLKIHFKRRFPCHATLEDISIEELMQQAIANTHQPSTREHRYPCRFCSKAFTSSQGRYQHQRYHCKLAKQEGPVGPVDMAACMQTMQQNMEAMRLELERLKSPSTVQNNTNNNTNTNTNSHNTIHNNITIHAYDKPNLEYLTPEFLTQCVKRRDKGLCELLEHIHYHPEHAENHNIRLTNKRSNYIETHNGKRFMYQDKEKVLDELVREGFEILENHYVENEYDIQQALNYNETRLEEIREFIEACREQQIHVITPLKQNVFLLILNNQYIIFKKKSPNPDGASTSAAATATA